MHPCRSVPSKAGPRPAEGRRSATAPSGQLRAKTSGPAPLVDAVSCSRNAPNHDRLRGNRTRVTPGSTRGPASPSRDEQVTAPTVQSPSQRTAGPRVEPGATVLEMAPFAPFAANFEQTFGSTLANWEGVDDIPRAIYSFKSLEVFFWSCSDSMSLTYVKAAVAADNTNIPVKAICRL